MYSTDETPFAFYAGSGAKKSIHLTAGGLTSLDLSAIAATIEHQLLNDDGWWLDYLFVERALVRDARRTDRDRPRPGLKLWVSPEMVLGCDWNPQSKALETRIKTEYELRMNMLAFMLAHETGQVVLDHDAERRSSEKPTEYSSRLRENEIAADNWALPALVRMRVNPYDVVRALFTHLVIFGSNDSEGQVHRNDITRIKQVAEVYQREFPFDYSSFNAAVAGLLQAITPNGEDQSLFDYLDTRAEQASFGDLHYRYRKNPVSNLSDVCRPPEIIPAWIRELSKKLYHPR